MTVAIRLTQTGGPGELTVEPIVEAQRGAGEVWPEQEVNGAIYSNGPDWGSYIVQGGLLVMGQNPGSSSTVAQRLVEELEATA